MPSLPNSRSTSSLVSQLSASRWTSFSLTGRVDRPEDRDEFADVVDDLDPVHCSAIIESPIGPSWVAPAPRRTAGDGRPRSGPAGRSERGGASGSPVAAQGSSRAGCSGRRTGRRGGVPRSCAREASPGRRQRGSSRWRSRWRFLRSSSTCLYLRPPTRSPGIGGARRTGPTRTPGPRSSAASSAARTCSSPSGAGSETSSVPVIVDVGRLEVLLRRS